jgi:hypothetical protein
MASKPYMSVMPKHDLPDGSEHESNVVDFRRHLRRADGSEADVDLDESEPPRLDVYRRAEHSDGRRPRFGRYDVFWLGLIACLAWMLWLLVLR